MDGEKLLYKIILDEYKRPGSFRRKKALAHALALAAAVYIKELHEMRTQGTGNA